MLRRDERADAIDGRACNCRLLVYRSWFREWLRTGLVSQERLATMPAEMRAVIASAQAMITRPRA